MESFFKKHEPCPSCGSRDNLARYSDNHAFCFGCGYREAAKILNGKILTFAKEKNTSLPKDFTRAFPAKAYDWLKKYDITLKEIWENEIGWSDSLELLIFPVTDDEGDVVMWQGRNFREGATRKYLTFGAKNHLHILEKDLESNTIILCEDVISAIKLRRIENSLPLFGSFVSNKLMDRLSLAITGGFENLMVWLDPDKQGKEYVSIINRGKTYFKSVKCIISEKDPKYYSTEELKDVLSKKYNRS